MPAPTLAASTTQATDQSVKTSQVTEKELKALAAHVKYLESSAARIERKAKQQEQQCSKFASMRKAEQDAERQRLVSLMMNERQAAISRQNLQNSRATNMASLAASKQSVVESKKQIAQDLRVWKTHVSTRSEFVVSNPNSWNSASRTASRTPSRPATALTAVSTKRVSGEQKRESEGTPKNSLGQETSITESPASHTMKRPNSSASTKPESVSSLIAAKHLEAMAAMREKLISQQLEAQKTLDAAKSRERKASLDIRKVTGSLTTAFGNIGKQEVRSALRQA